ncbi:MAG TPA: SRPBCC family protein [Gammaproteobacteria bacterium]|nr:SRPBCC family protein [Gammaproteobacteria bacterium]
MTIRKVFHQLLLLTAIIASAAAMAEGNLGASREVTVNAAPATVWKMIGNFNHLDVWHPVVVASEMTGEGNNIGNQRVLTLADGATITEKLLAHDDDNMTYTYAILESPLPVSDYVSTISVKPAAEGMTMVKWTSTFNAKDAEDAKAIETIGGIYDAGLNNLVKHFNK